MAGIGDGGISSDQGGSPGRDGMVLVTIYSPLGTDTNLILLISYVSMQRT